MTLIRAYFAAHFLGFSSVQEGGCETCGFGGIVGLTLEGINEALDEFVKHECQEE